MTVTCLPWVSGMYPVLGLYRKFPSAVTATALLFLLLLYPCSRYASEYPSFHELVDATAPNATLSPPAGTYSGPVIVDKPITIDGRHEVVIDSGGKGSVRVR